MTTSATILNVSSLQGSGVGIYITQRYQKVVHNHVRANATIDYKWADKPVNLLWHGEVLRSLAKRIGEV
jgi:hypothetical protein